jgi:hypothetical protein
MSHEMYLHELNPVKGWPDEHAIDKAAVVVLTSGQVVNKGAVMSLRADRRFQLGLACNAMPIFAFNASTDWDAVPDVGGMVGPSNAGVPLNAALNASITGLVAASCFELQSTEFDPAYNAQYVPNAALTAYAPGNAKAGQLKPGTQYQDTLCGICSTGLSASEAGIPIVQFWSFVQLQEHCGDSSQHD